MTALQPFARVMTALGESTDAVGVETAQEWAARVIRESGPIPDRIARDIARTIKARQAHAPNASRAPS